MTDVCANAFQLVPGRCFRLIVSEQARGQPVPCPGEVVARGRWRDGGGKVHVVEACREHAGELADDARDRLAPR